MIFAIITIIIGLLIVSLIFAVICYPNLLSNLAKMLFKPFRKRRENPVKELDVLDSHPKVKKNSPEGLLITRLEAMEKGQALIFKINPTWGARYLTVELKADLNPKKRDYLVGMNDTPDFLENSKETLYNSDDAYFIARSILGREGEFFQHKTNPLPETKVKPKSNFASIKQ